MFMSSVRSESQIPNSESVETYGLDPFLPRPAVGLYGLLKKKYRFCLVLDHTVVFQVSELIILIIYQNNLVYLFNIFARDKCRVLEVLDMACCYYLHLSRRQHQLENIKIPLRVISYFYNRCLLGMRRQKDVGIIEVKRMPKIYLHMNYSELCFENRIR